VLGDLFLHVLLACWSSELYFIAFERGLLAGIVNHGRTLGIVELRFDLGSTQVMRTVSPPAAPPPSLPLELPEHAAKAHAAVTTRRRETLFICSLVP
jgi:hypothetical protein